MGDSDFEIVDDKNIRSVSMRLGRLGGSVVYAEEWSFDRFFVFLCRTAEIREDAHFGSELVMKRNHRSNREYSITPVPDYSRDPTGALASGLFDRLDVGAEYMFSINPLCTTSLSPVLRDNCRAVYVPSTKGIPPALKSQFDYSIARLNANLKKTNQTQIDPSVAEQKIMPYVVKDLRTEAILRDNIRAGSEADAICGM